jgi:ABC-type sugar transport system ATPase subunit
MIRVVVENLVKRYDEVAVVDGASMEVRPGELSYVLGPSGSGKTTLARLIAGLEPVDDGEIYFDGRLVHEIPPQARRVGVVFQEDALWPRLTVAENLGYPLKVRGVPRRDRKRQVADALGSARLDTLAGKRPDELSGLQRQRVALARALVLEPDLLILDDPLGRLEARVRDEFLDEIRRVVAEVETTTLILTSDAREALALADHLAVMDLGRIVQSGSPASVYNRPVDTFVARFLGPINLIQGQVESTDPRGDLVVRTPLGRLVGRADAGPLPPGSPVTVALRPEALVIGPNAPFDANRFVATVERLVFLGEVRRVHLRGPNDWPVTALALQSQSQGLREGQGLTVHVTPEHVVVLPAKYALTPEPAQAQAPAPSPPTRPATTPEASSVGPSAD